MTPLAIGSDGGGSIRIPAALCGVVGMKASIGRVPLYPGCRDERLPGASGWESIEHIGPLARSVSDAALMLSVWLDPMIATDIRCRLPISIGCPPATEISADCGSHSGLVWAEAPVDPEISSIVADAARVFEDEMGCSVEIVTPDFNKWSWAFLPLVMLETDLRGHEGPPRAGRRSVLPPPCRNTSPTLVGRGTDRRSDGTESSGQQNVAAHGTVRLVDHAVSCEPGLSCRVDGTSIDRRKGSGGGRLDPFQLADELYRPARDFCSRRPHRRWPAGGLADCGSSAS